MKKLFILAIAALSISAVSCNNGSSAANAGLDSVDDSLSYYIGSFYGTMVKQQAAAGPDSAKFDVAQFLQGAKAVLDLDTADASKADGYGVGLNVFMTAKQMKERENVVLDTKAIYKYLAAAVKADSAVIDPQMANVMIQQLLQKKKANSPEAIQNKKSGEAYISEMMAKDSLIKKTASGLAYKVVKPGSGKKFVVSDRINVIYTGKKIDGTEFDSSKGQPVPFSPSQVVPGFKEGLLLMSPGAEYILYIPGELAYGAQGAGPGSNIGPNETLVFEVSTPSIYEVK